jgi:aerobic carbon-monoxide dehydrogenase large subunit
VFTRSLTGERGPAAARCAGGRPRSAPCERTEIAVTPAGRVEVVIGTQPNGQGHETSFAQVVSALLAVRVESIDLITGDTDVVSLGGGSHSGRSMRHSATLFAKAAPELIAKGKAVAARILETSAEEVAFADGRFATPRRNRSFDFLELAQEAARLVLEGELAVVTDKRNAGSGLSQWLCGVRSRG